MKKNLNVSVIIPAFNEEKNIRRILLSLLRQVEKGFLIRKITVLSDGSRDGTVREAIKVKSKILRIIEYHNRIGKVKRLNQFFPNFTEDVLVQLDADIILKNRYVIYNLIIPFKLKPDIDLVCGANSPLVNQNLVERVGFFGVDLWNEAKRSVGDKAQRYNCTGQIRAFSKTYLKGFKYPKSIGSGEDVYSFYYAKNKNFSVAYAADAIVYFRLPSTVKDYVKQMSRFISSSLDIKKYFSEDLIKEYETITRLVKIKALIITCFKHPPQIVVFYVLLQIIPKIHARFIKRKAAWDIAESSKDLGNL